MLLIEVMRRGGEHFEPRIEDHDAGCVYVVHEDDITEEGAWALERAFNQQARRWVPRPPGVARGERIPVTMERRGIMDSGVTLVVDDRPGSIHYTVQAALITEYAAAVITRKQSERSPDWLRLSARQAARLTAV